MTRRAVARHVVVARGKQLVSHVQAMLVLDAEALLQRLDADLLVADVEPHVVAAVEGAVGEVHLVCAVEGHERLLHAQHQLVQLLAPEVVPEILILRSVS